MKTATGRNTPAVYVEDFRQNLLKTVALSKSDELHFENRKALKQRERAQGTYANVHGLVHWFMMDCIPHLS